MSSSLIVSKSEKAVSFFESMLKQDKHDDIMVLNSGAEARRALGERDIDLVIVDVPLNDEPGSEVAIKAIEDSSCQVILTVKADFVDEVTARMEPYGIITVAKPINRSMFWTALKMADAVHNRMRRIQKENDKLVQKIEDIRMIDRAKLTLITYLNMTESEAHRYMEKQAMDLRKTKRQIAENILKTYKN